MESKTLGLITAPGLAKRMVKDLKEELPELLKYYVKDDYEWEVIPFEDTLTGGTNDSREILKRARSTKEDKNWDYSIALTDLPLFSGKTTVIAEVLNDDNIGIISLPGLGMTPLYKRIREGILQLMNEMYHGSSSSDRRDAESRIQSKDEGQYDEVRGQRSDRLMGKRFFESIFPLKRETTQEDESINVRFIAGSRTRGTIRLVSGMVNANRPWEMFPAFIKVLVIAFTTGSYALVFPTLWTLSSYYTNFRLILLMVIAILALVGWIIIAHNLWEGKKDEKASFTRRIYNATTFFSLLFAVVMYYLLLFILFSLTTFLFIPGAQLESQLQTDTGPAKYFYIAWTATSIATIIGALGSVFENESVVLDSMYGYRQRQRQNEMRQKREEDKQKD